MFGMPLSLITPKDGREEAVASTRRSACPPRHLGGYTRSARVGSGSFSRWRCGSLLADGQDMTKVVSNRAVGILLIAGAVLAQPANGQLTAQQSAVLSAISRSEPVSAWPRLSSAQLEKLQATAEAYEANYQSYHRPYGLTADVLFQDRTRKVVEKFDGIGDSATWAGHYLAALAFKYAVTKQPKTLAAIHQTLDAFDRLTHVTGKNGYIARFAGPADDPRFQRYYSVYGSGPDPERPGLGTWAFRGSGEYTNWVWLGFSSQDVYIGVNFGLAMTHRVVTDDLAQRRVRGLIETIVAGLSKDSNVIQDDHGRRSRWQLSPLARAALLRTAASVNPERYLREYERAFADLPPSRLASLKHGSYFPNNLQFASYYVLATLETAPERKKKLEAAFRELWRESQDHLNAYFALLYLSATGDRTNVVARATAEGMLADFPAAPRWDHRVDQAGRADLDHIKVNNAAWSKFALFVSERPPNDFLWQRSPCQLSGGNDAPLEYPGLDFLLPYWLGRYAGLLTTFR